MKTQVSSSNWKLLLQRLGAQRALGANTKANTIKTMKKEVVIDQGEGNIVFAG